jgi:GNAT superfamily N-acetyltransferase
MKIIEKKGLSFPQKIALCQLWNSEFPDKLSYKKTEEFDVYLSGLSNTKHYLLIGESNEISGWAFSFIREGERWFSVLLDKESQGQGKGTLLLSELKKAESKLCGWVVDHERDFKQNGAPYKSPLLFYLKNGFTICRESRIENEKLSAVKITWLQV